MKSKIASLAMAVTLVAFSATPLSAKYRGQLATKYGYIGAGYAYVDDLIPKSNGGVFNFGAEKRDESLYYGAGFSYSGADVNDLYISVDFQLGYMLRRDTVTYGTLFYNFQGESGPTGGAGGFGYGAGVKYQLFEHFGLDVRYKQASMSPVLPIGNYDYKSVQVVIEFNNLSGKGGYEF